jgi:anti-anti-sigma factor
MSPSGELSVKNIDAFYKELKREIENHDEIIIDLSGVARIDLAAAQVIIAAGKKAREFKKIVRLTGVKPELKKLLGFSGVKV